MARRNDQSPERRGSALKSGVIWCRPKYVVAVPCLAHVVRMAKPDVNDCTCIDRYSRSLC